MRNSTLTSASWLRAGQETTPTTGKTWLRKLDWGSSKNCGQALKWGMVPRNVSLLVDLLHLRQQEVKPLTPEQAKQLFDAVMGTRLEALYAIAMSLGLRKGELLGLTWEDIDFDQKVLRVRTSIQRIDGKLQFGELKTESSQRSIVMSQVVIDALRRHKIRQLEEKLVAGPSWRDTGLVFTTTIGTPLEPRNLTRHFHRILDRLGLPRQRFYDLRHTCCIPSPCPGHPSQGIDGDSGPQPDKSHHEYLCPCYASGTERGCRHDGCRV